MPTIVDLGELPMVTRAVTPSVAGTMREACIISLDSHGHCSGVQFTVVNGGKAEMVNIVWSDQITQEMRNYFRDGKYNVDHAACAISLMIVPAFTEFTAAVKSRGGDGVDFFLVGSDPTLFFNGGAYLEVSGILAESKTNSVDSRIQTKTKRIRKLPGSPINQGDDSPIYICVVEFSRPWSKLVEYVHTS